MQELTPEEYEAYCRMMRDGERYCSYCGREIDPSRYYVKDQGQSYHLGCIMEMEVQDD